MVDLVPAHGGGVPVLFASIQGVVVEVAFKGGGGLVKACGSPLCQFAFVGRTRNQSGRSSTSACGSRVTLRAHRQRSTGF